jgi:hypothetical protein
MCWQGMKPAHLLYIGLFCPLVISLAGHAVRFLMYKEPCDCFGGGSCWYPAVLPHVCAMQSMRG